MNPAGIIAPAIVETFVATYLRLSDDDEDLGGEKRESDSILNQRRVLENYISNHDELSQYPVREFVDDGGFRGELQPSGNPEPVK